MKIQLNSRNQFTKKNKRIIKYWLFILFIGVVFTSCKQEKKSPTTAAPENKTKTENVESLQQRIPEKLLGNWFLEKFNEQSITNESAVKNPAIEISEEGQIIGNSGCNKFKGDYRIEEDRVKFTVKKETEIECQDNDLERKFLHVFSQDNLSFILEKEKLIIFNEENTLVFEKVMDKL